MQKYRYTLLVLLIAVFGLPLQAQQETAPFVAYDVPAQNLLKFNRFLLNPTFSTVREDKSYINLFHRNQSVSFDDNNQTYFLSYSGRIGDRSGLGLSLYTQREGLIDNFGLLANYAYGIKLSDKSNFTFGGNFSYYNSGFNQDRANPIDDDPLLNSLDNSALITFQPGFNISYGAFDFGVFAENLFDYNLKTSESITDFDEKTFTGHFQYTHQFKNATGILESGRLMPLARVSSVAGDDVVLGGSLILDLPKLGWLQAGYDDFYGAAAGIGFNLNKRISLGYTVEKGLSTNFEDFGVNHEISLAYSFTPNLTEDRVMLENDNDALVNNEEEETPMEELTLTEKDLKIAELERRLAENDAILDELLMRQDSIEQHRQKDLERRFSTVMKMVRRETQQQNPEVEQKARELYFDQMDKSDAVASTAKTPIANDGLTNTTASRKAIQLDTKKQKLQPTTTTQVTATDNRESKKDAIRYKKSNRNFNSFSIPSIESGHYLIANVYKGTKYMNKFIQELKDQGIEADYFTNPRNGLNYVYLKNYTNKETAIAAYRSGMDGAYQGDTWVMKVKGVDNSQMLAIADNAANTTYDDSVLQQNVRAPADKKVKVNYKTIATNGIDSGFYIIANVFENPANANRFVRHLNAKGLSASYFINPENKYRYVFLKKHDDWTNALTTYYSKLNDAYHDPIWIMRVKPNQTS